MSSLKAGVDIDSVKQNLDGMLNVPDEHQTTLTMTTKNAVGTLTYSVSNLGATAVTPTQITTKLKGELSSKTQGVKNVVGDVGTIATCCQTSSSATAVVEENAKVKAASEAPKVAVGSAALTA